MTDNIRLLFCTGAIFQLNCRKPRPSSRVPHARNGSKRRDLTSVHSFTATLGTWPSCSFDEDFGPFHCGRPSPMCHCKKIPRVSAGLEL